MSTVTFTAAIYSFNPAPMASARIPANIDTKPSDYAAARCEISVTAETFALCLLGRTQVENAFIKWAGYTFAQYNESYCAVRDVREMPDGTFFVRFGELSDLSSHSKRDVLPAITVDAQGNVSIQA